MYDFDLKKDSSHIGIFYYSDDQPKQFPGMLCHSPGKGISLNALTEVDFDAIGNHGIQGRTIHGFAENIGKVSLLSCLQNGASTHFGEISYSSKKVFPALTVFGKHCNSDESIFTGISFHFPEMDSFCTFDIDSYFVNDKALIMDCTLQNGLRAIIRQGRREQIDLSRVLPKRIKERIGRDVDEERVSLTITKPFYCIHIEGKKGTVGDYIKEKHKITKLFSVLSLQPIYCDFLSIHEDNHSFTIIEKRPAPLESNKLIMPHMPITIHSIKTDFPGILERWDSIPTEFVSLFIDRLYNEAKAGHQQYCMMIAALGSWQVKNGKDKTYRLRYENILDENLNPNDPINEEITEKLKEVFGNGKTFSELGCDLGRIRDYFLHIDSISKNDTRYKHLQSILNNETIIMNLCEILFIFMAKITYSYLGIILSDDQKQNLARKIVPWKTFSV